MGYHLPRKGLENFIGISVFSCIEGFHSNTDKRLTVYTSLILVNLYGSPIIHMNSVLINTKSVHSPLRGFT